MTRRFITGFAVAAATAASIQSAAAQTIRGTVLDEMNEEPVGGVAVSLVEAAGDMRFRTLTDSIGRFVVVVPEAGEYTLVAQRFGYLETISPLLALVPDGEATMELMVTPEPLGLEGVQVSVEENAAEELRLFGLSPVQLGNRWIDRERIEAIPVKRDMGTILEHTGQAGVRIVRPENQSTGSDDIGLCISQIRATRMGVAHCALIVYNGVPIGGQQALDLDPDAIESIAILTALEASIFYGTAGGAGAVLVWTRRGR